MPSKPSCKLPPSIASHAIVNDMSFELISSPIGSQLYGRISGIYHIRCMAQKNEFLLRRHSSLRDSSIVRFEPQHSDLELPNINNENASERIGVMQSLLERIEKEAEACREAFIIAHSALKKVEESEIKQSESKEFKGATPGLTISMCDMLLDACAITNQLNALQNAQHLFNKTTHRHILNGGADNADRHTMPSALIFNAVMRAASNTPFSYNSPDASKDEQVRDKALNASFRTFDKMHHADCANHNSATYFRMLRMLKKCMPDSRVRGNVVRALFNLVVEDKVMDDCVHEELKVSGSGKLHESWLRHMDEKDGDVIEEKWRVNAIKRSYHVNSNVH